MRVDVRRTKSIIVIEDDEILLDSYEYFINSFDGFNLKGLYSNFSDAIEDYENTYPDIIISDISLPGINGVEAIKRFKILDRSVKILMISVHDDIQHILESIKNKADGYLTKPVSKKDLHKALLEIETKGSPLSADVSKKIMTVLQDVYYEDFSKRENEIISLLKKGDTYNAIASKLFISASTVNFHIQNIYTKLDVNNKTDALKILFKNNL